MDLADDLQDRINSKKEDLEKEKQRIRDLLKLVKEYLMGMYWADNVKDGNVGPV